MRMKSPLAALFMALGPVTGKAWADTGVDRGRPPRHQHTQGQHPRTTRSGHHHRRP